MKCLKLLAIALVVISVVVVIQIPYYLLGNVDNSPKIKKENLLVESSKYLKIIENDLKNNKNKVLYMITDGKIEKNNLQDHSLETLKKLDNKHVDGILLFEDDDYQYYTQIEEYCISKKNKKSDLVIEKKTCDTIKNKDNIKSAIEDYALDQELVADSTATGADTTKPYTSKKYYTGKDPNNYIIYSGSCYRIMNISQNDTIKIIYEGPTTEKHTCKDVSKDNSGFVALLSWDIDKTSDVDWDYPTDLYFTMDEWVKWREIDMKNFSVTIASEQLAEADWYIGRITKNNSFSDDITQERSKTVKGYIGLINPSDYNKVSCKKSALSHDVSCSENNYLYKSTYSWWTLNRAPGETKQVWSINDDGKTLEWEVPYSKEYSYKGIRPVFYLRSDLEVTGFGTDFAPYVVN